MKNYFGAISLIIIILMVGLFFGYITSVTTIGVTTFRILMICGVILSLLFSYLCEKGTMRRISLGISICVGLLYLIGIELMRVVFQENGF
ncbi:hypothetical protein ACE38V_20010 [Cytobacillus sp. Hz8]|uniref:hypothetical protein n=1 Tax=Cytobacillus sp. Hz8 TaxID=3347168 RepID=UPI0035E1D84A